MPPFAKYVLLSVCLGLVGDYQDLSLTETEEMIDRLLADNTPYISTCMASVDSDIATQTNFLGREIPIAMANFPPFLNIISDGTEGNVQGKGMSWELMNTLASHFNFTPVPVVAKHDLVGLKEKSGQWLGALNLLYTQEAEFTVLPVTYTDERQKDFEFSLLLGTTTFGILVKRPAYTPKPDALLRPFSLSVWWWILGSTAVMGPLIYFIIVFRVMLCKGDPTLTRIFPFEHCVWFVFGAMMKQGSVLKPISDSSRILFATWWLFIMIVTSFYTANLTAFLTFNGLELTINNIQDLAKGSMSWLAYKEGALVDVIKAHPKTKVLRELEEEGRGAFVESRAEAIELVDEGTHVYIDDIRILNQIIQDDYKVQQKANSENTCRFYVAQFEKGNDFTFWYGYAFKKGSLYKDVFNRFFRRLSLFGIMDYLHLNATSNLPVCTLPKGFKERKLQLQDLITTYIVTAIGFGSAVLTLLLEFFCGPKRGKMSKGGKVHQNGLPSISKNITVLNVGHSIKNSVKTVEWSDTVYKTDKSVKGGNQKLHTIPEGDLEG